MSIVFSFSKGRNVLQKGAMLKTLRPFMFLILISFFENRKKNEQRAQRRNKVKIGVP